MSSLLKTSIPWTKGYFAFPPPASDSRTHFASATNQLIAEEPRVLQEHLERAKLVAEATWKEEAWQERCRRDAQRRTERLERERTEALVGEMAWVRAGGSLRDALGRRDVVRTEQLRAEIRLLDEEQRLMTRWNAYETRWRTLIAATTPISFADIPWPVIHSPHSMDELHSGAVEEFLLAPLRVRGNTITKRERIRASILRWHPDKLSVLLQRVVQEDADVVREGVNAVFRYLKALQDSIGKN
ncbi:uncharacterized protein FIBRA_06925 [Fibroporia radiculosa]|uniref:J domain-containing protein n=1 Tax=Fibroporia radiculosa TaxID=599839 RepID=J4HZV5_9APHY|nr:uncharacterized protein FIBRA_06925 [Fibroporia radiculosa]CCM04737.1 predicted protein [Fibroporia radiculosa]